MIPCWCFGQTVTIQSNREVCLNELISFRSSVSGGTVASSSWTFGDGASSTQNTTSHIYTTTGSKKVSVVVTFTDGSTATADQDVMVHDLPTADFTLQGSNYCIFQQDICLIDNSTMGSTTSGYQTRTILWGEGSPDQDNTPTVGETICFTQYPKVSPPTYTIITEVVNDKGCEDLWEQEISILTDYVSSFSYEGRRSGCDEQIVCFTNDSNSAMSDVVEYEWDYGDGTASSTVWGGQCHTYTASGNYIVTLRVKLANGCESIISKVIRVVIQDFDAPINVKDTVKCFPQSFNLSLGEAVPGANYAWELFTDDTIFVKTSGFSLVQNIQPSGPGNFLVRLKISRGGCSRFSRWVNLKSEGVDASFIPLNGNQCELRDTVYFYNTSRKHPEADPSFTWDFGDELAPSCIGIPLNCNLDTSYHTQHFYRDTGCYIPSLVAVDRTSGCRSAVEGVVSFVSIDSVVFLAELERPCVGVKDEYAVLFSYDRCNLKVSVCRDSLKDSKDWVQFDQPHYYPTVADSAGRVTVGFAITFGDKRVFRSPNPSDYYIDLNRECTDTIWKNHWFTLYPEPKWDFTFQQDSSCLPVGVSAAYVGDEQNKLSFLRYRWETGMPLTTLDLAIDPLDTIRYIYTDNGVKNARFILEDTNKCYVSNPREFVLGYYNEIFTDTSVCLGQSITLIDSILYYNSAVSWWRDTSNVESIRWDLADGNGFSTIGPLPSITYTDRGEYLVRMATRDKNGCTDTAFITVNIGGVIAAIQEPDPEYLCDQIIQFFDSSYFEVNAQQDKIKEYYWDFGDFSTPSYLQDPFHYYSSNGFFTLTHAVTAESGCTDTTSVQIFLRGPEPYFDIVSDTMGCVPFTATFSSISKNISSLLWRMGDDQGSTVFSLSDTIFEFTYTKPGIYYISVEGSDSFFNADANNTYTCSSIFPDTSLPEKTVRRIVVLPIPEAAISLDDPLCVGKVASMESLSDTAYTFFQWQINGEEVGNEPSVGFTFTEPGTYEVKLIPTYDVDSTYQRACYDTAAEMVNVSYVKAAFGYENVGLCNEFNFTDSSINAETYNWDFGNTRNASTNQSEEVNPSHYYGRFAGEYHVCLKVAEPLGCIDSICKPILVEYTREFEPYNVFTPNGDGINDEFLFTADNLNFYDLRIYNRWGELLFETRDHTIGWDGSSDGINAPETTYFYVLKYSFNCNATLYEGEGTVELIRSEE